MDKDREGWREGRKERERERERERASERASERGREGGREGEREREWASACPFREHVSRERGASLYPKHIPGSFLQVTDCIAVSPMQVNTKMSKPMALDQP